MSRAALLLLATVAGCSATAPDACAGRAGTCLSIDLEGDLRLDSVALHVTGDAIDATQTSMPERGGAVDLPVAVAALFPAVAAPTRVDVVVDAKGFSAAVSVGEGSATATVVGGAHSTIAIHLTAANDPPDLATVAAADFAAADDGGCTGTSCGECTPSATRCAENTPQSCDATGHWQNEPTCIYPTPACSAGKCVTPPSCTGVAANCGGSLSDDCCNALSVPAGSFKRSYDAVTFTDGDNPATLSAFRLGAYEVTVARFRQFIAAGLGTQKAPPPAGAGALPGQPTTGWDAAWNGNLAVDAPSLVAALSCSTGFSTYTPAASTEDNHPINCVTWYEAFAFCVWDGGRLPSEAEWNYAAAGGNEQRVYPWSSPATATTIAASQASYYVDDTKQCYGDGVNGCALADLVVVGSHAGQGRWGHLDLAGNITEWVLDYASTTYVNPCVDCVNLTPNVNRRLRGGSYFTPASSLTASVQAGDTPLRRTSTYGFRCAYAN